MFRDDRQRGEVCFILTAWVRGEPWRWTETGYRPGLEPVGLSTGEDAMVRFSMALWSGHDLPIWQGFDSRRMRDLAELLLALNEGPESIDGWIRTRVDTPLGATKSRETWERRTRERSRA